MTISIFKFKISPIIPFKVLICSDSPRKRVSRVNHSPWEMSQNWTCQGDGGCPPIAFKFISIVRRIGKRSSASGRPQQDPCRRKLQENEVIESTRFRVRPILKNSISARMEHYAPLSHHLACGNPKTHSFIQAKVKDGIFVLGLSI